MSFGYAVLLPILRFLLGAFVLYDAKKTGVPYPLLIGIGIALLPFASFPLYIFYQYKRLGSSLFDGVVRKFAVLVFGMFVVFSVLGNTDTAEQKLKTDIKEQQKETVQKKELSSSSEKMSLAEKKLTSDDIRSILKNGNAKISVDSKEHYNSNVGGFDYKGTSQDFTYYYSNSIAREGLILTFYDDITFQRGDSNFGSFIYIKKPYSVLTVTPIKDNERIGWDKVVFGNENDEYEFFVKDKKITNPNRNTFTQKIYLGEETVKCYQILLGKNPYIRFVKNDGSFVLAKIYDEFKDDSKMLDAMYDVVRLIPKINSLKEDNGKAYLY